MTCHTHNSFSFFNTKEEMLHDVVMNKCLFKILNAQGLTVGNQHLYCFLVVGVGMNKSPRQAKLEPYT